MNHGYIRREGRVRIRKQVWDLEGSNGAWKWLPTSIDVATNLSCVGASLCYCMREDEFGREAVYVSTLNSSPLLLLKSWLSRGAVLALALPS